jgi:hypothetical protein
VSCRSGLQLVVDALWQRLFMQCRSVLSGIYCTAAMRQPRSVPLSSFIALFAEPQALTGAYRRVVICAYAER